MRGTLQHLPAKFIAVLAIVFQAILPGALAAAYPERIDLAGVFCLPSGDRTPAAAQAMDALADLLEDERETGGAQTDCPLCVTAHAALPSAPETATGAPRHPAETVRAPPYETLSARRTQGPPLGLRAPPSFN